MDLNLSNASFVSEDNFLPLEEDTVYDVFIIGGGPAGMTAAVYCMRKGLKTGIVLTRPGGQVADTAEIENYMGYRHLSGAELTEKFRDQVIQFSIGYDEGGEAVSFTEDAIKKVTLSDGRIISAKSLIIASGKSWRRLGVPGEERLTGRGVAFCAICDAPFFRDKKVVVVGGGNSGIEAAIDLAGVAEHVLLVQELEALTGDDILQKKLNTLSNVTMVFNSTVEEIIGEEKVTAIRLKNTKTGELEEMPMDGIFVEIGLDPNSKFVPESLKLNEYGEIIVDCNCATSVPGVFAAGDVTTVEYKQIIVAAGEGAKAALSAWDYVLKLDE